VGDNTTCKDRQRLLDALISKVGIWGREERCEGSRTLPTANDEFLRFLVPLNSDAENGTASSGFSAWRIIMILLAVIFPLPDSV
jgi:hypothetical protein